MPVAKRNRPGTDGPRLAAHCISPSMDRLGAKTPPGRPSTASANRENFRFLFLFQYCMDSDTSDKRLFPTFARTRPPDTQISKSVAAVLKAFNWTQARKFAHDVLGGLAGGAHARGLAVWGTPWFFGDHARKLSENILFRWTARELDGSRSDNSVEEPENVTSNSRENRF